MSASRYCLWAPWPCSVVAADKGNPMTETMTPSSPSGQPQLGLLSRVMGVIFSPRETFAAVVARPKWFGAIAIAVLISGAAQFALLSTDLGQDLALEQQVGAAEAFGITISDEAYANME